MVRMHGSLLPGPILSGIIISGDLTVTTAGIGDTASGVRRFTVTGPIHGLITMLVLEASITVIMEATVDIMADFMEVGMIITLTMEDISHTGAVTSAISNPETKTTTNKTVVNKISMEAADILLQDHQFV